MVPYFPDTLRQTQGIEDAVMEHILNGYRGLSLLFDLNWDRILYVATIIFALCAGAFIGSL